MADKLFRSTLAPSSQGYVGSPVCRQSRWANTLEIPEEMKLPGRLRTSLLRQEEFNECDMKNESEMDVATSNRNYNRGLIDNSTYHAWAAQ